MDTANTAFSSKRLNIRRPPLIVSAAKLCSGLIVIAMALVSALVTYDLLTRLIRSRQFNDLRNFVTQIQDSGRFPRMANDELIISLAYALAILLFGLVFLPTILGAVIRGLRFILIGLGEIVRPWMPALIPLPFRNYADVINGFKQHILSLYRPMENFVSATFGKNTMFLSPVRRRVVAENARYLKGRVLSVILTALTLGGVLWFINWLTTDAAGKLLPNSVSAQLIQLLTQDSARAIITTPLIWLIGLFVALGVIEFVVTMLLVPPGQPPTMAHEASDYYRGFGHPNQLINRLPSIATSLQWQGFLNRHHADLHEQRSSAVGDAGSFTAYLTIEQQPHPIRPSGFLASYLLLVLGWGLQLAGFYIILFELLPWPVRVLGSDTYSPPFLWAPLFVILMAVLGRRTTRAGVRFADQAYLLFDSAWFSSTAILIDFAGNLSRADVRVGKSVADSIESSNLVVRSDFTANFWSAELISEASSLTAERELLALKQTPESMKWVAFFRREINSLRDEGVQPIRVDVQSQGVGDIMQSNLQVSTLRAGAMEKAQIQASQQGTDAALPDLLKPLVGSGQAATTAPNSAKSSGEDDDPEGWKVCPECAEKVRARARKCRFCGYRFWGSDLTDDGVESPLP